MLKLFLSLLNDFFHPQQESPIPVITSSIPTIVPKLLITRKELLQNRDLEYPLTPEIETNLSLLLGCLNTFRLIYGKPLVVTSGYRPGRFNVAAGGAPNSAHITCEACDFSDTMGEVKDYVLANPDILVKSGLYMEHPDATPSWIHLQIRATKNRIFRP